MALPKKIVIVKLGLQSLAKTALAGRHTRLTAVKGGNQGSHKRTNPFAVESLRGVIHWHPCQMMLLFLAGIAAAYNRNVAVLFS